MPRRLPLQVLVGHQIAGQGTGASKRLAEQAAARAALADRLRLNRRTEAYQACSGRGQPLGSGEEFHR